MMLYLTGASSSLTKSEINPQTDVNKSLGGYISSTPVPNAAVNSLFDLISSYTLEKRQKETIAIALVNKTDKIAKNIELKIVTDVDNDAVFKVAVVSIDSKYQMEQIANRYQEPINAEFHDVSFYRAAVEIEINQYGSKDEEIVLYPFNVMIQITEEGIEGTWRAFEEAFNNNETYTIKRITESRFRIERRDEEVLEQPIKCSYITTAGFSASFIGEMDNKLDNTVLISNELRPNQAIGIWLQRIIKKNSYPSNNELLKEYKDGYVRNTIEEVEMIIDYDSIEEKNYNEDYNEEYS